MKELKIIDVFDIDDLTNDLKLDEQLNYIFDYVDNKESRNDFDDIDKSINKFIKNGLDFKIDLFVGFLVAIGHISDKLNNYNKLYNEAYVICKKTMDKLEIEQVLSGLKRDDYDNWVRSMKVHKIKNIKNDGKH